MNNKRYQTKYISVIVWAEKAISNCPCGKKNQQNVAGK